MYSSFVRRKYDSVSMQRTQLRGIIVFMVEKEYYLENVISEHCCGAGENNALGSERFIPESSFINAYQKRLSIFRQQL